MSRSPSSAASQTGRGCSASEDQDETTTLLEAAGFTDVVFELLAPSILIGGPGTVDQSMDFLLGMGMVRGLVGRAVEMTMTRWSRLSVRP